MAEFDQVCLHLHSIQRLTLFNFCLNTGIAFGAYVRLTRSPCDGHAGHFLFLVIDLLMWLHICLLPSVFVYMYSFPHLVKCIFASYGTTVSALYRGLKSMVGRSLFQ